MNSKTIPRPSNKCPDKTVVEGELIRVKVFKEDTNFAVLIILDKDDNREYTALGVLSTQPNIGSWIKATGKFGPHTYLGHTTYQLKWTVIELTLPTERRHICKFLENIPGVGGVAADKIVDALGIDCLRTVYENPETIKPFIHERFHENAVRKISEDADKAAELYLLSSLSLGPSLVNKCRVKYGKAVMDVVQKNPYQLALDIKGITFTRIDNGAMAIGQFPASDPRRVAAAIVQAVDDAITDAGHTFVSEREAKDYIGRLNTKVAVPVEGFTAGLALAIDQGAIVRVSDGKMSGISTAYTAHAEDVFADFVNGKLSEKPVIVGSIDNIPDNEKETLTEKQIQGITNGCNENISVFTGGPGCGKTHALKLLIKATVLNNPADLWILAPTGAAARRAQFMTGHPREYCMTVHSFLTRVESSMDGECDVKLPKIIVLEEGSMLDIHMAYNLSVSAWKCKFIIVGDPDQLPSIGPGAVLLDMLSSISIPKTKLDKVFRQAHGSIIIDNAHRINTGNTELEYPEKNPQWMFYRVGRDEREILESYKFLTGAIDRAVKNLGINVYTDLMVLSPIHKSKLGVAALNDLLRDHLNPIDDYEQKRIVKINSWADFRVGDKVMFTKNNRKLGVVNGLIGKVVFSEYIINEVGKKEPRLKIEIPDEPDPSTISGFREVILSEKEDMENIKQAWAMTVHKSQGSQYKFVVIICHACVSFGLVRNLLYTAITRASHHVLLMGEKWAIKKAIENVKPTVRNTRLAGMIREAKNQQQSEKTNT